MPHEDQVAVEVHGQKDDCLQLINASFFVLFGEDPFFSIFVKIFRNESVFGGDSKIGHGEMQKLLHDSFRIQDHPLNAFS